MIPEHRIWEYFPTLHTNRLELRKIHPVDIHEIFAGLSDQRVIQYYGVSFETLTQTEEQMDWYESLWKDRTGIWWGICQKGEQQLIGACGFNNYEEDQQKAELGYWLIPEYWGRGFASEALKAIVEFGFEQMQLHRIEAFVEEGNKVSGRILEKFQFIHEGTMRNCEYKNGRFISLMIYALLKE